MDFALRVLADFIGTGIVLGILYLVGFRVSICRKGK